ncbi:MAG: TonB-dependent receptor, partial [Myxococcota bacterium]|nr:TonB-dependent receptor [Myxococcota bacterium]
RRSYFDAIIPFVVPDDIGGELTVAPRYWDYQGRVNVMLGGGHELEAFAYGSDDVLEFIFSSPQANNPFLRGSAAASTSFHRGQLTWNYRSDTFRNRLVYNFGSTVLDFGVGDSLRFLLDILQHTVREEARFELDDRLAVVMGMDMVFGTAEVTARLPRQRQDGEFAGGFDTLEYLELGVEQGYYQPAAFMEVELDVLEELLLVLGGRFDYARELGSFTGDLRSSLRWTIDKNFSVTGGVGRFSQAPEFQATAEDFGNPDLDWQHAVHYALGGSARAPFYEPLTLEITGFYKSLNDLVAPSTDTVIRNGRIEPERFANTGEGRVYGAELLLRHELANNFFGWIAYTVSRAERNDQPGEEMELFEFDQTHILTALASYKLPAQWQIGLRFRYVTGRPFTPQEGAVFDADADAYQPLFGVPGSQRVEAFHQLDLRVDKSWVFDWWILSAYLDIQGVYFHANPEFIQYNFDSTQQGYVRGLPILPSIGIKGEF